jgi:hypothetical protein
MRFDPAQTAEEWLEHLRHEAERTWGHERAQAIDGNLVDLAQALHRICSCPVSAEEEPFLLDSTPFSLEDVPS